MCAASALAPLPLYSEGQQFWKNLTDECHRHVECVNATLLENNVDSAGLLSCVAAPDKLRISEPRLPSFNIELTLEFRNWGPVIAVILYGQQGDGEKFLPQSLELPVAIDLDREIVAIYDEGRSFSTREVASYLIQYFHCCYPNISFPC